MKIIILVEDLKAGGRLKNEHGLSLYIEKDDKKYLLDVGKSDVFIKNAKKLGVDISDIDAVFISHNHYDHIGGLKAFFKVNYKAKVYLKEDAKNQYYAKEHGIIIKISGEKKIYSKYLDRFVFVKENFKLNDIYILSDIMSDEAFFCQDKRLLKKQDEKYVSDDFSHEMFIGIKEKGKIHVLSSCSHRGIVNILKTVEKRIKIPIGMVIAGLHMSAKGGKAINCSEDYFSSVMLELEKMQSDKIYTCHCTGLFAFKKLKKQLGDKIEYIKTGETIII
jgi:7,8-dihydropterin-6-yl-methyl-4-(beta-D-ribofuranosyl)aminobenzene 5'-phosphate synthase